MQLQLATWPDIETYLKTSDAIVIPIGSTEQHGPIGLIGTDALCAEIIAKGVGEATGALVAPTIAVGMAQHHLGFPGSITLRPSTLIAVIQDTIASLARHGFRRFYFINGHGGNIATVTAAFSEIYAESSLGRSGNAPGIRCKLRNWWESPGVGRISKELFAKAEGSHATPSEVSLTWYGWPEAERHARLDPPIAPDGDFTDAADYRRNFPDGRIGANSDLATREAGKRLYEAAVGDLAQEYRSFAARAA